MLLMTFWKYWLVANKWSLKVEEQMCLKASMLQICRLKKQANKKDLNLGFANWYPLFASFDFKMQKYFSCFA